MIECSEGGAGPGEARTVERIVDSHCHIASTRYIPRSFIEGAVSNMALSLRGRGVEVSRELLADRFTAKMADDRCDELVAEMDAAGITCAALLFIDFRFACGDCEWDLAGLLAAHVDVLKRHPNRFVLFAGIDPRSGQAGVDLLERSARDGEVAGLKLYPPCGFDAADPRLDPLFEVCADYGLPVLVHTGATSPALCFDTSRPETLDRPARRFPSVNFIMAHGSTHYVDECVMMCAYRPNIYLDISAYQAMPLAHLAPLFTRQINHKILFGTDWPVFRLQGTQRAFVDQLLGPQGVLRHLHQRELEAIFHDTFEALLAGPAGRTLAPAAQIGAI